MPCLCGIHVRTFVPVPQRPLLSAMIDPPRAFHTSPRMRARATHSWRAASAPASPVPQFDKVERDALLCGQHHFIHFARSCMVASGYRSKTPHAGEPHEQRAGHAWRGLWARARSRLKGCIPFAAVRVCVIPRAFAGIYAKGGAPFVLCWLRSKQV